ncbi:F-box/kelch-repeat protein At3g06240-like [Papaver somniferum]|uniref:F-box/kelch-repeat protein At3g06240-like n=1 Tax=Papaver somniferum TaxID=3469 RepID=UPI000E7034B6|nr:F-box/kelch-repeat protein At3g06240-like [Papaver somniferum]
MHDELNNLQKNTSIMFCEHERKKLYTIAIGYKSVLSVLPLSASSTTMCEFMNQMNYPSIFQDCKIQFLSSCNGLVWISRISPSWVEDYYIWNPSTKVYKNIPMAREVNWRDIKGYGFGCDNKTDDYKLIRIVVDWESECSSVDIYTLSSNSWKNTQTVPYHLCDIGASYPGVLFKGALHYPAHTFRKDSTVLVCFNIVSEGFEEVAVPKALIPYPKGKQDMLGIDVGVSGECLCLAFHVFNVRVDVWIMQDYGLQESWTNIFSITQESITSTRYLELVWSFKNNETLWEVDQGIVLYDPTNKTYRKLLLDSHGTERETVARNYMVTSVWL